MVEQKQLKEQGIARDKRSSESSSESDAVKENEKEWERDIRSADDLDEDLMVLLKKQQDAQDKISKNSKRGILPLRLLRIHAFSYKSGLFIINVSLKSSMVSLIDEIFFLYKFKEAKKCY